MSLPRKEMQFWHTHAPLMLKQGVHPKVVQERLGHSSIQMTIDIYSHVSPGLQQAAVDGFDKLLNNEEASTDYVRTRD
jgi:integrase